MDPFIEGQVWEDFHLGFISVTREALIPRVRPRFVVRAELRVYLEHEPGERPDFIRPDVAVLERPHEGPPGGGAATATTIAVVPVTRTLPLPVREHERFLTVRERESLELVTVIELLSPGNKRRGSDGRREYLDKREAILMGRTHLVELDLLRGGERLPTIEPLPSGDYYAFVSRATRLPTADVYTWLLRQRLPMIPVPLSAGDEDVILDLQAVFDTVYDRAGYDYSLDYRRPIEPPLSEADAAWVREALSTAAGC
jgi:hypothetical protein